MAQYPDTPVRSGYRMGQFQHFMETTNYLTPRIREAYQGRLIINGGFDDKTATEALANNEADAIVFGSPFIANLDLVERYSPGQVLNTPDSNTFYTRNAIVENPDRWEDAFSDKKLWQRFGDIESERLKRAPRGYDSDHAHVEHLKLKSFIIRQPMNETLPKSPELPDEVIAAYTDSTPLTGFLTRAIGLAF